MIENDLISAFKFLNRTDDDFIKFFENKKSGWRYLNKNTQLFFWMRYSANSLKTHKDTENFDKETLEFILNTSPLHAQSLIIPKNELERLKSKFNNFEKYDYKKPNIIYNKPKKQHPINTPNKVSQDLIPLLLRFLKAK